MIEADAECDYGGIGSLMIFVFFLAVGKDSVDDVDFSGCYGGGERLRERGGSSDGSIVSLCLCWLACRTTCPGDLR